MKQDNNVIRHPRRLPFTFITAVFFLMLIYIVVHLVIFSQRKKIEVYEVGSVSSDHLSGTLNGIILRSEEVKTSQAGGYANYFMISGDRVSKAAPVVVLDSRGDLEEKLHDFYYGQDILTSSSLSELQSVLKSAKDRYRSFDLNTLREGKADLRSSVFQLLLKDGGEQVLYQLSDSITYTVAADEAGFILLEKDGYEGKDPEDLSLRDFEEDLREVKTTANGSLIAAGDFLYKTVPDNKFYLVFPLTEEQRETFSSRKKLTVRMPDQDEITGAFSVIPGSDGTYLGVLFFQKYGGNYLKERKIGFKILDNEVTGYKIPESSVVNKSFFVVDKAFISESGTSYGVLKKNENSADFIRSTVYVKSEDEKKNLVIGDDYAYIYSDDLKSGDVIMADVQNEDGTYEHREMTLAVMASVEGVYQVNNGYCIFKPILRLKNSMESSYIMVSSSVKGTIKSSDRIVIDPSMVRENDIVFE